MTDKIDIYNMLKNKLGDAEAKVLVDYIEDEIERKTFIKTKDSINELRETIIKSELKLELKIEQKANETLKWSIAQWVTIILFLAAIVIKLYL